MKKLVVFILFFFSVYSTFSQDDAKIQNHVNLSLEAFNNDRFEESIPHFDSLIKFKPDLPGPYKLKGRALFLIGRNKEAFEVFENAKDLFPYDPDIYHFLGILHSQNFDDEKALDNLKAAIFLNPSDSEILITGAGCYRKMGSFQKAFDLFQKADSLSPGMSFTNDFLGITGKRLKKYGEAKKYFEKTLELLKKEENYSDNEYAALILFQLERMDEGHKHLDDIIAEKGYSELSLKIKGIESQSTGDYSKSLFYFQKVIEFDSTNAMAWTDYSYNLIMLERYSEALTILNRVIEEYPKYYFAIGYRGLAYTGLKEYEKALEDFNYGISLKPDHPRLYRSRGELYIKLGKPEKGCDDFYSAKERYYGHNKKYSDELETLIKTNCNKKKLSLKKKGRN